MTEDEMRLAIEASARDAIFFEPIFPPSHDGCPTTFFGGRPRLPPDVDWPVHKIVIRMTDAGRPVSARVASTFLAQIDLGRLAASVNVAPLPPCGTLYFFLDSATVEMELSGEPGTGGRVIYWPGDSSACAERPEPSNLFPCYGEDAEGQFRWLKQGHSDAFPFPRSFARWPVRAFACRTYAAQVPAALHSDDQRAAWKAATDFRLLKCNMQQEQFAAAFPAATERKYFVWEGDEEKDIAGAAWRGGPGFPYAWICIEIFAGMLLDAIAEYREHPRAECRKYRIGPLETETRAWLDRSRAHQRYTAVPASDREAFWRWYEGVVASSGDSLHQPRNLFELQRCLAEAYRVGPRLCLAQSAEAARLVPPAYLEHQRWQFAVNLTGHGGRTVEHRLLGASPEGPTKAHVLLLQLDSQEGLDWQWGDVGTIQYWITKQDLMALQFDNVIVTLETG
jgi:hypothetical protein